MADTPEVRAAQEKLDRAVLELIKVMGWDRGEHGAWILTSWALVAHQAGWDTEGEALDAHPLIYMGGSIPDYQALGLFKTGMDRVRGVGHWRREDDDG